MVFPEVHEADASGEIATIYSELRQELGLPLVNLIWRHFATLPGVLPWAWATVKPAARSFEVRGGLDRMGKRVSQLASVNQNRLPNLTDGQTAVVDIYNRGNTLNLQLLTALKRVVDGKVAPGTESLEGASAPPTQLPPVPDMPRLESLAPETLHLVKKLAGLHGEEGAAAIPSLYRHLALWPELLPPLYDVLSDISQSGLLAEGRQALRMMADATASRLAPALRPPAPFPEEHRVATLKALEAFTGRLIADLSFVGLLLRSGAAAPGR